MVGIGGMRLCVRLQVCRGMVAAHPPARGSVERRDLPLGAGAVMGTEEAALLAGDDGNDATHIKPWPAVVVRALMSCSTLLSPLV